MGASTPWAARRAGIGGVGAVTAGNAKTVAVIELSVAVLAIAGCVWSWLAAASPAHIDPVTAGEPVRSSVNYDPAMLSLSLVLATIAGVLLVLGTRGVRRTR